MLKFYIQKMSLVCTRHKTDEKQYYSSQQKTSPAKIHISLLSLRLNEYFAVQENEKKHTSILPPALFNTVIVVIFFMN